MPHMNVLDLSVFPNMSKRHAELARSSGGLHVLTENEVWEAAEKVWKKLPSSKIASGFVQARRIADKVIKAKGANDFLGSGGGGIGVGLCRDFQETRKGMT